MSQHAPSERYTLIYVDQTTGDHFRLTRTPQQPAEVTGSVDGPTATELLTAIAVDLGVLELELQPTTHGPMRSGKEK